MSKHERGLFQSIGDSTAAGAGSFAWLSADRAIRLALGFFVGALVARHLGPTGFGRLSYAVSLVALAGFIVPLGLDGIAKREILRAREHADELICTVLVLRIVALLVAIGMVCLLAARETDAEQRIVWAACGSLIAPLTGTFDAVLETWWLGKKIFLARSVATLGSTSLRVILVLCGSPAEAFALALSLESVLLLTMSWFVFRQMGVRIRVRFFSLRRACILLNESCPIIVAGLAMTVYGRVDQILIREYLGDSSLGTYAAAVRLTEIGHFLPVLAASTIWPVLVAAEREASVRLEGVIQLYLDASVLAGIAWAATVAAASPLFISVIYGQEFRGSIWILATHAWSSVFVFIGVAGGQLLILRRQSSVQLVATVLGACLSIGTNVVLLPRIGVFGAVAAALLAQVCASWLSFWIVPTTRPIFRQMTRAYTIVVRWKDITLLFQKLRYWIAHSR